MRVILGLLCFWAHKFKKYLLIDLSLSVDIISVSSSLTEIFLVLKLLATLCRSRISWLICPRYQIFPRITLSGQKFELHSMNFNSATKLSKHSLDHSSLTIIGEHRGKPRRGREYFWVLGQKSREKAVLGDFSRSTLAQPSQVSTKEVSSLNHHVL